MGDMDVLHDDENVKGTGKVCSSTITYMLGGTVGLSADLALIAQAAALAHEVLLFQRCFNSAHYVLLTAKPHVLCRRYLLESRKVCFV